MRRKKLAKFHSGPEPLSAHESGKFAIRAQETPDPGQAPASYGAATQFDLYAALTDRQLQILGLMAEPLPNPQIAIRLNLEVATVEKHIEHIFSNLDVQTRAEAVACFLRRKNEECQAERVRLVREKRQLVLENEKLREANVRLTEEIASARGSYD